MYILRKTSPLVQHPKSWPLENHGKTPVTTHCEESSQVASLNHWNFVSPTAPFTAFIVGLDGTFSVEVESGHLAEIL